MRTLFFLTIFTFFATLAGQAQVQPLNQGNYHEKAVKESERMRARLLLSPPQFAKIVQINSEYYRKLAELKNQNLTSPDIRRQKILELNTKRENDYRQELTTNQFSQYQLYIDSLRLGH